METMGELKGEVVITRLFDAPRRRVWEAWTVPEYVKLWWGPKDYTVPAVEIDLRVGGRYVNCMRGAGPDGVVRDYWSTGFYRGIVPFERIESTDSFSDAEGNVVPASYYGMSGEFPLELLITVTLEDLGDKTRLVLRHSGFPKGEDLEMAKVGWNESFDKLEETLALLAIKPIEGETEIIAVRARPEIIVARVLDAPRELVFRALTDRKLIPRWWGPRNLATTVEKLDLRPDGAWRIVQRDRRGNEYSFSGAYREVVAPERIVRTFEFEAMAGHGAVETATLRERDGKTILTHRLVFHSMEDRDGMLASGAEEGLSESHERLATLLKRQRSHRPGLKKSKKAGGQEKRRSRSR